MPGDIRRSRNGRRRLNKRGRRKRRIRRILSAVVVFIPLFAAAVFLKNFIGDHFVMTDSGITRDTGSYQVQNTAAAQSITDGEIRSRLTEMAQTDEKVRKVLEQADRYPQDLLELLANNEETADFVLDYMEKRMIPRQRISAISLPVKSPFCFSGMSAGDMRSTGTI